MGRCTADIPGPPPQASSSSSCRYGLQRGDKARRRQTSVFDPHYLAHVSFKKLQKKNKKTNALPVFFVTIIDASILSVHPLSYCFNLAPLSRHALLVSGPFVMSQWGTFQTCGRSKKTSAGNFQQGVKRGFLHVSHLTGHADTLRWSPGGERKI